MTAIGVLAGWVAKDERRARESAPYNCKNPEMAKARTPKCRPEGPALHGFGRSAAGDEFQEAEGGIAAGQSDQGEIAVGGVFTNGFDQEADGA